MYQVRVRATNTRGDGPWANLSVTTPVIPEPSAPVVITDSSTASSIVLRWEAPELFGSPLVRYELQQEAAAPQGGFTEIYRGAQTTYEVTGLEPVTSYRFRARAVTEAGISPFSAVHTADTTDHPPCTNDCNGHGVCVPGSEEAVCACDAGWMLPHCSREWDLQLTTGPMTVKWTYGEQ